MIVKANNTFRAASKNNGNLTAHTHTHTGRELAVSLQMYRLRCMDGCIFQTLVDFYGSSCATWDN